MAKYEDHVPTYGRKFPIPDVERIGIFNESSYMHGKGYVSIYPLPEYFKDKNFIGVGPKTKMGKADCYFDKEYRRIFEGEATTNRGAKRKVVLPYKKAEKPPFLIVGPTKIHSTPNDFYGTFSTNVPYMSMKDKKMKKPKPEGRNFLTKPGRKGTSGYANICMSKYPAHSDDRYEAKGNWKVYGKIINGPLYTANFPQPYFDPYPNKLARGEPFGKTYVRPTAPEKPFIGPGIMHTAGKGKLLGGCKCGGFSKYPTHSEDKYVTWWDLEKAKIKSKKTWLRHASGVRALYSLSIIDKNVDFKLNERTRHTFEPTYTKYLLD